MSSSTCIAYCDESGDEQPIRTENDPPVLVIAAFVVAHSSLASLTWGFLELKKSFSRTATTKALLSDILRFEIKGSDLRSDVRSGSRKRARRAIGIMDGVLSLLESNHATIMAEVHIKPDARNLPKHVYADSIAALASHFEVQLKESSSHGLMVLDSRTKVKNVPNVERITTQRFKTGGSSYPSLLESPVFGHSDSHVPLQVADILASAFLFPMACRVYCSSLVDNCHTHDAYQAIVDRYGSRLKRLEYRYTSGVGRCGGIRVNDKRGHRSTLSIFGTPTMSIKPNYVQSEMRINADNTLES